MPSLTVWVRVIEIVLVAGLMTFAGYIGWTERDVRARRDTANEDLAQSKRTAQGYKDLSDARDLAIKAANSYLDREATIKPKLQVIREQAAPVVVTLDKCPLPVNARGMLDAAADLAAGTNDTGSAANRADGTGTTIKNP
jgi:hypothetical protein